MDLEPQIEPKLGVTAEGNQASQTEGAAPAGASQTAQAEGAAPAMPRQPEEEKPREEAAPKEADAVAVPPIPSSALVILPPSLRRFDPEKETKESKRRAGRGNRFRYASRAAAIVLLVGGAFAAGGHFLGSTPFVHATGDSAASSWQAAKDDSDPSGAAAAKGTTAALSNEIHGLEARFDAMQSAVETRTPDEIRSLKKSIDGLKANLDAEKTAADASIAQLSAKLDQLQREGPRLAALEKNGRAEAKSEKVIDRKAIQATLDRAARAEKTDTTTTASEPASAAPKTQPLPAAVEPQKRPPVLTNWVVRDAYDGIALVEGPEGAIEVMPGDALPGAGVVKSIQRRGGGWVVLTSRGLVQYAGE